jgi:hypothetical protein
MFLHIFIGVSSLSCGQKLTFHVKLNENLWKILILTIMYQFILRFFVLSIVLVRTGTILTVEREITPIKNILKKHIILESNQECVSSLLSCSLFKFV